MEASETVTRRTKAKQSVPGGDHERQPQRSGLRLPPNSAQAPKNSRIFTSSCAKLRINLNQNAWDYIVGAAETETTLRRNRMALDEIAFRPRVLRDVSKVDASVEIFSAQIAFAECCSLPVGALETFDPGSAATVVRAADRFGCRCIC